MSDLIYDYKGRLKGTKETNQKLLDIFIDKLQNEVDNIISYSTETNFDEKENKVIETLTVRIHKKEKDVIDFSELVDF